MIDRKLYTGDKFLIQSTFEISEKVVKLDEKLENYQLFFISSTGVISKKNKCIYIYFFNINKNILENTLDLCIFLKYLFFFGFY